MARQTTQESENHWRALWRRAHPRTFWRLPLSVAAVLALEQLIWYNLEVFDAVGKLVPEIANVAAVLDDTMLSWPTAVPLVLTVICWLAGYIRLTRLAFYYGMGVITSSLLASVGILVYTLAYREGDVSGLIWDAGLVWVANVIVFACWYWGIDGEHAQARASNTDAAIHFQFPQRGSEIRGYEHWQPRFVDYLFLAFTTSTAFSPTDTAPLSRRAKLLMMIQAALSLVILAVLAARAINILKPAA
jgi:hypothetical protein